MGNQEVEYICACLILISKSFLAYSKVDFLKVHPCLATRSTCCFLWCHKKVDMWQVQQSGKGTVVGVAHTHYKHLFGWMYHPYRAVIGSQQLTIMIVGYSEFEKYDQTSLSSFLVETASHFSSMTVLQSTGKFRIRYLSYLHVHSVLLPLVYLSHVSFWYFD